MVRIQWSLAIVSLWPLSLRAEGFEFRSPTPMKVFQREGFVPGEAHPHAVGGPARGFADMPLIINAEEDISTHPSGDTDVLVRVSKTSDASAVMEKRLTLKGTEPGTWVGRIRLPAGGWYKLELELEKGDQTISGSIEPVGVGEVFLIAGQSYATNTNEETMTIQDQAKRVAAWNFRDDSWSTADDPQPTPDGSDGGSIWPPLGDQLVSLLQVPIGFANVAWGGTSSEQWLPGGELHQRLVDAGKRLGRFRAVLWQQGESDVIGKTPIEKYVANLTSIRQSAVDAWGKSPRWLLAKSTLHPTVYNDNTGETRIRHAIDELTKLPGFAAGPDTDLLDGDRRGPITSRRHFTGIGQREAAQLWFQTLWTEIHRPRPDHEIALTTISEQELMQFPWMQPVVHWESSVLFCDEQGGGIQARLAFQAEKILSVRAANRSHAFNVDRDVTLHKDGRTITFREAGPVVPFKPADLYPSVDAPSSYKHRVGHPAQGLFYAPGTGFLDRDVEISYVRAGTWIGPTFELAERSLPRTLQRLREGKTIRIGVSGDSISFGWDASRMSDAPPFQFPYPSLVAAQITESTGCEVQLVNRAVSGWSVSHGVEDLPKLLAMDPDLVIVAYGMNDVGRRDPAWFGNQTKVIVERIRNEKPTIEIILVSPMLGNREWIHTPREMFPLYRDELAKLVGDGVALADVTKVWQTFLEHKHDLDLTGNGLNHPNDFGHRLYAQTILALLVPFQP